MVLEETVRALISNWRQYGIPEDYKDFPDFKPDSLGDCVITNELCPEYLSLIHGFIRIHGDSIKIVIVNEDNNGKADKDYPDTLFISQRIDNSIEEIKRTVIHELAHLTCWFYDQDLDDHGSDKDICSYYKSMPLVCEYCLTGHATYAPLQLSNSTINEKKTQCIISK